MNLDIVLLRLWYVDFSWRAECCCCQDEGTQHGHFLGIGLHVAVITCID